MVNQSTIAVLLASRLVAHAPLTTLVGERIRPHVLAQGDPYPGVTYGVLNTVPDYDLSGESGAAETRVEFAVYALDYDELNLAGNLIVDQLAGFAGFLGSGDERRRVYDCVRDNDYERTEPPAAGDARWVYRRVIDFLVNHSEPIPTLELTPLE